MTLLANHQSVFESFDLFDLRWHRQSPRKIQNTFADNIATRDAAADRAAISIGLSPGWFDVGPRPEEDMERWDGQS